MRVHVNATACSGYGTCAETCPEIFELDEFGYAAVRTTDGEVPAEAEAAARNAVAHCPEKAISAQD